VLNWYFGYSRSGCLIRGAVFGGLLFFGDQAMERSGLTVANAILMVVGAVGAAGNFANAVLPRAKSS
jgi:hypothetical protein